VLLAVSCICHIVRNSKLCFWDDIEWHNVHIIFHENHSNSFKFEREGYLETHKHNMVILCLLASFFLRKENRLKMCAVLQDNTTNDSTMNISMYWAIKIFEGSAGPVRDSVT
jgi:hypothetical protein